jgi:hypothetical protein
MAFPVNVGFAIFALDSNVDERDAANDADSDDNVFDKLLIKSNVFGNAFTKFDTSLRTYSVVAICVVNVPTGAVGAVGTPVKFGEITVAYPWFWT